MKKEKNFIDTATHTAQANAVEINQLVDWKYTKKGIKILSSHFSLDKRFFKKPSIKNDKKSWIISAEFKNLINQ